MYGGRHDEQTGKEKPSQQKTRVCVRVRCRRSRRPRGAVREDQRNFVRYRARGRKGMADWVSDAERPSTGDIRNGLPIASSAERRVFCVRFPPHGYSGKRAGRSWISVGTLPIPDIASHFLGLSYDFRSYTLVLHHVNPALIIPSAGDRLLLHRRHGPSECVYRQGRRIER